jgi:hypothetical protein
MHVDNMTFLPENPLSELGELDDISQALFFCASPEIVNLLQAIVESYEGMGILRTLIAEKALLVLIISKYMQKEALEFLSSLEERWQIRMLSPQAASTLLAEQGMPLSVQTILGELE